MGIRGLLYSLLFFSVCHQAAATDLPPRLSKTQDIPGAIQISITPRGQKYFEKNLQEILGNLGLNLSEGYFQETSIVSSEDVNLDELEKKYPEPASLIKQVRTLLTKWLVGFTLKDHRPAFRLGSSEYSAEINRLALLTDQKLMDKIGKDTGAVLVFEMEIKKLTAKFDSVSVWDANNEHLGELGMKAVTFVVGGGQTPLFMRLPFYVYLDENREVRFEALKLDHNLQLIPMEIRYQHLVVPQLVVELNGVKYPLNNQELEETVERQVPDMLVKVREYVAQFANSDLPTKLNELAKTHLKGRIEEVEYLVPPSLPEEVKNGAHDISDYSFLWGLKLQRFYQKNNLYIDFDAFIEDPKAAQSIAIPKGYYSRGKARLDADLTPHDLAMSVDRAVINRALQLSFQRGYFEKIAMDDGSTLVLRGVPTIDYAEPPQGSKYSPLETFAKIHVAIEQRPGSMFLEDVIVLEFDIISKLVPAADGEGMEIVLYDIDINSVKMDNKYYAGLGNLFKKKVLDGIKNEVKKIAASWKQKRTSLDAKLDLPPPVLGQRLQIQKIHFDSTGNFVMYLNFQRPNGNNRRILNPQIHRPRM